jgi:hypothetical protein
MMSYQYLENCQEESLAGFLTRRTRVTHVPPQSGDGAPED